MSLFFLVGMLNISSVFCSFVDETSLFLKIKLMFGIGGVW